MRCEQDGRVADAAAVGAMFGMDPVVVLAERDPVARAVRIAGHNVLVRRAGGN